MPQLGFDDVQTWAGEFSRERVIRNATNGLTGSILVRAVMNLQLAEESSSEELLWRGDVIGFAETKASSSGKRGTARVNFFTGVLLGINQRGYRLDFDDIFSSDPQAEIETSGVFDDEQWIEGDVDVFEAFAWPPDLAWLDVTVRIPVNPIRGICQIVTLPAGRALTAAPDDDRHREAWILYPDPKEPWTEDHLAKTAPWSLWNSFKDAPEINEVAKGSS
jgi:hypothetical protein